MQRTLQLCLAATVLSTQVQAVKVQAEEEELTQCQKNVIKKYNKFIGKCDGYIDDEELATCEAECFGLEDAALQKCEKQCLEDQLGFCWKVAGEFKGSLWFQCGMQDGWISDARKELKTRQCTTNVFKKADAAKYLCYHEHMQKGTHPDDATADCKTKWTKKMIALGDQMGCPQDWLA